MKERENELQAVGGELSRYKHKYQEQQEQLKQSTSSSQGEFTRKSQGTAAHRVSSQGEFPAAYRVNYKALYRVRGLYDDHSVHCKLLTITLFLGN